MCAGVAVWSSSLRPSSSPAARRDLRAKERRAAKAEPAQLLNAMNTWESVGYREIVSLSDADSNKCITVSASLTHVTYSAVT